MNARRAAAAALLVVVLALAGCGRLAQRLEHGATSPSPVVATTGASPAATSPGTPAAREDVPTTPAATAPAAADVAELQQALDAANGLADQVDQDIASDGS